MASTLRKKYPSQLAGGLLDRKQAIKECNWGLPWW
jgi:hypothetical protein